MHAIPWTAVSLLCLACSAAAQSSPAEIPIGQRIRLTAPGMGLRSEPATFAGMDGRVLLASADTSLRLPLDAIERIEVHAGRRSHPWRGAGIGFLSGAALGFGLWYATDAGCYPEAATIGCATVFGAFGGGLLGALAGALVGGLVVTTDRWQPLSVRRLGITIGPRVDGRVAAGLSVRYGSSR